MQKTKNEHYVPQFYLRKFAFKTGKKYFLYCYDKISEKAFPRNIADIACESYFYDTCEDSDQKMEKGFAKVEGHFERSLSEVITARDTDFISQDDRLILSCFVAMQLLRTREMREAFRDIVRSLRALIGEEKISEKLLEEMDYAVKEESLKNLQLDSIRENAPAFADCLKRMKWIFVLNDSDVPFWTSDHPVALHNENKFGEFGNKSIALPGIQILLPLTPKKMLIVCDLMDFFWLANVRHAIKDNVTFYNSFQVTDSTRHTFSNINDFTFAKFVTKTLPEVRDPNRFRIRVRYLGASEASAG